MSARYPLFVVGCQRSGTTMLIDIIGRAKDAWIHGEAHRSAAFRDYRLRSDATVQKLIRSSPAAVVAFKPLCDSHLTDHLLDLHPESRAIWIYRDPWDVANSAVRNFGDHQRDIISWIAVKNWKALDWRGERLSAETLDLVDRVYREDLTPEEGAILFWWIRNQFFFQLGLDRDSRVRLVRYEDLVLSPQRSFPRVFEFARCTLEPEFLQGVSKSSIRKNPFPEIDPEIQKPCETLMARLDAEYRRQHGLLGAEP